MPGYLQRFCFQRIEDDPTCSHINYDKYGLALKRSPSWGNWEKRSLQLLPHHYEKGCKQNTSNLIMLPPLWIFTTGRSRGTEEKEQSRRQSLWNDTNTVTGSWNVSICYDDSTLKQFYEALRADVSGAETVLNAVGGRNSAIKLPLKQSVRFALCLHL